MEEQSDCFLEHCRHETTLTGIINILIVGRVIVVGIVGLVGLAGLVVIVVLIGSIVGLGARVIVVTRRLEKKLAVSLFLNSICATYSRVK